MADQAGQKKARKEEDMMNVTLDVGPNLKLVLLVALGAITFIRLVIAVRFPVKFR